MDNMTAKVSCYARAYHYESNDAWIFKDEAARMLLGEEMYNAIAMNMTGGIQFFCPGFEGTKEEALEFIVDNQLSPSVLGRSAFNERHLINEMRLGAKQYVIFASGYDTYAYRNNTDMQIFELDLPQMIDDKITKETAASQLEPHNRVMVPCDLAKTDWKDELYKAGYQKAYKTYASLLGISYYLDKAAFTQLIEGISDIMSAGSAICFDYPSCYESEETMKNEKLANGAGEEMKAKYTVKEIENMLSQHGFLVYEQLDDKQMTEQYFDAYNRHTGKNMVAPAGVEYVLAVKQ